MTVHEKRLVIRGMSMARGLMKAGLNESQVGNYLEYVAEAWDLEPSPNEQQEFMDFVTEVNDAIAIKHPEWRTRDGRKHEIKS